MQKNCKYLLDSEGCNSGCIYEDVVVGGEADNGRVSHHCCIGLIWRLEGDAVILFCMPTRTKGAE